MKTPIHKSTMRYYSVHRSREAKGRGYRENVTIRVVASSLQQTLDHFVARYPDVEITALRYDGPVDVILEKLENTCL